MRYPSVLTEDETLDRALAGASLARYGDGELKLCMGGTAKSQGRHPVLQKELRAILSKPGPALPCIPNTYSGGPKEKGWAKYSRGRFLPLFGLKTYGSAFVTRPDSAPWIDRPEYWAKVRRLWQGRDVTLVIGDRKSLREENLEPDVRTLRMIHGPHTDAYREIDDIEERIGTPDGPVLLCLGATATVLAHRLAAKGVHAIDLGHIGMFMRRLGAYAYRREDLCSDEYRAQLAQVLENDRNWKSGYTHAETVAAFADDLGAKSILDYGCGQGTLREALPERTVWEYDPGVERKAVLPKPADLVVCTDVLEHVEPSKLHNVLAHLYSMTERGAFLVIATGTSSVKLPDGRDSHLTVEKPKWWLDKLEKFDWRIVRQSTNKGLWVWLKKPD